MDFARISAAKSRIQRQGGMGNDKWKIMAAERAVFKTRHFQLSIFHFPEGGEAVGLVLPPPRNDEGTARYGREGGSGYAVYGIGAYTPNAGGR
jgi:hypothetical protein